MLVDLHTTTMIEDGSNTILAERTWTRCHIDGPVSTVEPPFGAGANRSIVLRISNILSLQTNPDTRDENGFGIFRNSGNRFRNFSIGFTGNGIFRKRNRFSEFSIGIGIGIGVVFYRPFLSVTGFCRKLPDLCLGNFRNCVSEFFRNFFRNFPACDFFASPVHFWIRIAYFCIFWTL
jgi:hypothetical protein